MVDRSKSIQIHPKIKRFQILIDIQGIEVEVEPLHLPEMNKKSRATDPTNPTAKAKIPGNHLKKVPEI